MQRKIVGRGQATDAFLTLDRPGWAWEFLRRNPQYEKGLAAPTPAAVSRLKGSKLKLIEAPECSPEHRRWGLCTVEAPCLPYAEANVFWDPAADPAVLVVSARRGRLSANDNNDRIDFRKLPAEVTVLKLDSGVEHIRIVEGARALQLSVIEGSVLHGPVALDYHINGFGSARLKILALRRLIAFRELGRFPISLYAPGARAKRWLLELRALDMLHSGCRYEEMVGELFGVSLDEARSDWARSRLRRLLAAAKNISEIGYFGILAGTTTKIESHPLGWPRGGIADVVQFPSAK